MPLVDTPLGPAYYAASGVSTNQSPIVLIHGAGGSHLDWPPAFRRFPGRRTLGLDLPGHGRSPTPGRQSIDAYAAWVREWLLATETSPAILVGHSMGGALALELAWQSPERVAALVVIGAGPRLPVAPAILDGITMAPQETIAYIVDLAYGRDAPAALKHLGCERMAQVEPQVLHGDFVACDQFDMTTRLGEVAQPALIVAGSRDHMAPPAGAVALHEGLPRSELVLIEGAGHMLTFERTDEVMRAIRAFLSRAHYREK